MSKKVDFRNDERMVIVAYLKAKVKKAQADKEEKEAKKAAKPLFERLGKAFKETDKSSYIYGSIQEGGEVRYIVYRDTTSKGRIDWEAYARDLGATDEGAEAYRKPATVSTSLDYATDKQVAEING